MKILRSILLVLVGVLSIYMGQEVMGGGIYEVPVNLQSVPVRILNQVSQGFGISLIVAGLVMIVCAIPSTLKRKDNE